MHEVSTRNLAVDDQPTLQASDVYSRADLKSSESPLQASVYQSSVHYVFILHIVTNPSGG